MAKETPQIEVHLRNDWYTGSRLLRPRDNPHFLPPEALEALPSSAKVKEGEKLVPVEELRSTPTNEELAAKEKETVKVPATVKKEDLKI